MNILLTGSAGFIGHHFARLYRPQHSIVGLDILNYAAVASRSSLVDVFVEGDIADIPLVTELLHTHRIEAIIHCAAQTHVDQSLTAPMDFMQHNAVGTMKLLMAAQQYWESNTCPDHFRFVQVSTDEVYGSIPSPLAVDESAPLLPSSPYSASKVAAEGFAHAWHVSYGLPVVITRCSNNYGSGQFPEKLIPKILAYLQEGRPIPIYGNGQQVRDWLHVTDHCHALYTVLQHGKIGEIYNIAAHQPWCNIDIVQSILRIVLSLSGTLQLHQKALTFIQNYQSTNDLSVVIQEVTDRLGHDQRYAMNDSKIRQLGWQPQTTFQHGLTELIRWHWNKH